MNVFEGPKVREFSLNFVGVGKMGYSKREIGAVNIDFNLVTMFIVVIVNFNAKTWHVVKLILTLVTKRTETCLITTIFF